MKKSLITLFYLIFMVLTLQGCGQHQEEQTSPQNPQIIMDKDTIILVSPSEETIDTLKAKMGDDFYTIADDANYYASEVNDYLTFINKTYINAQDNTVISYLQKDGKLHIIKNDIPHLYWWAVVYKGNEETYRIIDLINFKDEYEQFMHIKNTYPADIALFVNKRRECDHLREEIQDKPTNDAQKRTIELDKYCKGTDQALMQLIEAKIQKRTQFHQKVK